MRQRSVGATLCVACAAYLLREGLAGGIGPGPDEEAAAGPGGRLEALAGAMDALPLLLLLVVIRHRIF